MNLPIISREDSQRPLRFRTVSDASNSTRLGPLLLITGTAALLVLAVPDWRAAVPWGWFHRAIPIWLMLALAWTALGVKLLGQSDSTESPLFTGRVGPRFRRVVLYSRDNCPLCDEAQALLDQYSKYLPPVIVVDISTDEELTRNHGNWIPVVEIDGKIRFRGRVSELLLRRMIRMAQGH
jgi:glutaredoxin